MLGKDHYLNREFPKHQDTIIQLAKNDKGFAKDSEHYNALDKKIRELN